MAKATLQVTVNYSTFLPIVTLPDGTVIPQDSRRHLPGEPDGAPGPRRPRAGGGAADHDHLPLRPDGVPARASSRRSRSSRRARGAVDFKVSLDTTGFHWDGFGSVGNPAQLAGRDRAGRIGRRASELRAQTAAHPAPPTVVLSLVTAAQGVAYGPAQANLVIAHGKLTGIIYYESYSGDTIPPDGIGGTTDFGLWAVKPGRTRAAVPPPAGLRHLPRRRGGGEHAHDTAPTTDGRQHTGRLPGRDRRRLHAARDRADRPALRHHAAPVDSRGLGWGTVSPDGKVVLRELDQFWGGETLLAWAVPGAAAPRARRAPAAVDVDDGQRRLQHVRRRSTPSTAQHLVYVNATNAGRRGVGPGRPASPIGIVDIATTLSDGGADGAAPASSRSPTRRTIYDSTTTGRRGRRRNASPRCPTFLPDSQTHRVRGDASAAQPEYNHMLPDYENQAGYVDGELAMLQPHGERRLRARRPHQREHRLRSQLRDAQLRAEAPARRRSAGTTGSSSRASGRTRIPTLGFAEEALGHRDHARRARPASTRATRRSRSSTRPSSRRSSRSARTGRSRPARRNGASCQTGDDCCNGSCRPQSASDPVLAPRLRHAHDTVRRDRRRVPGRAKPGLLQRRRRGAVHRHAQRLRQLRGPRPAVRGPGA